MNINDRKGLKAEAAHQLSQASYNPRLLMLIHTAVTLGAGFLVAIIGLLLQMKINTTSGLSGISTRTVLETAQSVLETVVSILTPFWGMGIIWGTIRLARGQVSTPRNLLFGFRRFGPILRLKILQALIYAVVIFPCVYVAIGIASVTPVYNHIMVSMTEATTPDEITAAMGPLIPIIFAVMAIAVLPIYYRIKMSDYVIMDTQRCGALEALAASWDMTRGKKLALFKLDLSFWWYLILRALTLMLVSADLYLADMGITLPVSDTVAYFVCYLLYMAAELVITWYFNAKVHTTYALAYEVLREQMEAQKKKTDWNFGQNRDQEQNQTWEAEEN